MEEKNYIEIQKVGNKRPFKLPENYFNDFAERMDKLTTENVQKPKPFRLRPWMYGAAASLIGILFLGQVYLTNHKSKKLASETFDTYDTYILSQVSESSIIDYYLTENNN